MHIQHSPPEIQIRSQIRTQFGITPNPRASLVGTPAVPQLGAHLDRETIMERPAPSSKEGRGPRRSNSFLGVVGAFPSI
ncbi:hypothetical protein O181_103882 [Austropuccinia psidii MF-1]|uniref:Uncharacterized protein n=1 Tax=Austropuccinia psidii MF-1 TaxID=1389203 RepID=A0A9Q3JM01_9BASI|nr:hypothetical protein [Austropuccinia psidii MF-1]